MTQEISILRGTKINALISLDVELFKNSSIDSSVNSILSKFSNSFGIELENKRNELIASIGKISEVKCIKGLDISYTNELNEPIDYSEIDLKTSYFIINYQINSNIVG